VPVPQPAAGHPSPWNRWREVALAVFLAAYFLIFNWSSLRVHFALDDLANIRHYFEYSPAQLVLSNFLPWRGDYRPLGGLFYIPIYHFAGLNPVPYQAVLLAILLLNAYLAYRLVRLLGGGELPAALVALVCCYHGGLANLYYNAAFVYDALCCCLYLAALVYYVGIRNRGKLLGMGQTLVFLALLLAALNAKEMAVSIPVMVLAYEWIYRVPSKKNRTTLLDWVRGPARMAWIAGALTLVDIYGKVAGREAMANSDAYRPVFTLERARAFHVALLQDLLVSWSWTPGWVAIIGLYVLLAYLAWRRADRPVLRLLFCFLVVAPLPIEFLEGRREACFALLMVGGAAFVAVVFVDAVAWAAESVVREFRLPVRRELVAGLLIAAAVLLWVREQRSVHRFAEGVPMTTLGDQAWDIVEQMRASDFHPRPGSSVAFLDDPFHSLDMYSIALLWFHDRSIRVHGVSQGVLTPQELAKMDYVFTIENRKLIRIR
jgi:hypothetical protein